jgi:flagellar biosynthetic protein FliR
LIVSFPSAAHDLPQVNVEAALLSELPRWAFAFALVLARTGCACMMIPGIGETELPATVRAGLALVLTILLLPPLAPLLPSAPDMPFTAAAYVVAEVATGLWLGWLARLPLLALGMGGQYMASFTGLASVLQPDPTLGPQTTAPARLFGLAAPVVVLASGLHALPLAALAGSYRVVPAGTLLPAADTVQMAVHATGECMALAVRLAAPFLIASLTWQVAMALLARLVPALQVHFAASPGQILGGMVLLALLGATVIETWRETAAGVLAGIAGN